MKTTWIALPALLCALTVQAADDEILRLTQASGCVACHQTEPSRTAGSPPPLAPAWREIATRYKSVKGAQQQLTATVMTGSLPADQGRSPYASHWTGKVRGEFMPTHRHAVTQADAARIVAWILALEPARQ